MEELKPCPFCGGKADIVSEHVDYPYIGCEDCDVRIESSDWSVTYKEDLIEGWNKRSISISEAEEFISMYRKVYNKGNIPTRYLTLCIDINAGVRKDHFILTRPWAIERFLHDKLRDIFKVIGMRTKDYHGGIYVYYDNESEGEIVYNILKKEYSTWRKELTNERYDYLESLLD